MKGWPLACGSFILGVALTAVLGWKRGAVIPRWEYYVKAPCDQFVNGVVQKPDIAQTLNASGSKGWELVQVLPGGECPGSNAPSYGVYILKRPLP